MNDVCCDFELISEFVKILNSNIRKMNLYKDIHKYFYYNFKLNDQTKLQN